MLHISPDKNLLQLGDIDQTIVYWRDYPLSPCTAKRRDTPCIDILLRSSLMFTSLFLSHPTDRVPYISQIAGHRVVSCERLDVDLLSCVPSSFFNVPAIFSSLFFLLFFLSRSLRGSCTLDQRLV